MREVVAELTASKSQRHERGDLRARSYADFEQRGEKFATAFEGRIASEVSADEIKKWLNGLKIGSRSNKNYLAVIGEVFKLAAQRRYVPFSPLDSLTDTDRKELCGGMLALRQIGGRNFWPRQTNSVLDLNAGRIEGGILAKSCAAAQGLAFSMIQGTGTTLPWHC